MDREEILSALVACAFWGVVLVGLLYALFGW